MRRSRIALMVTAAVATAVLAATALGGTAKTSVFTANFKGVATTKVTDTVVDITAKATGTGTVIGKSSLAGVGKGTKGDSNCVPFSGPATIVTAKKLKGKKMILKFTVLPASTGCAGDDQNTVTVSGTGKFAGGTGTFKRARGTFTFSGYYDRNSGAFTVKFTGRLTV